VDDRWLDKIQEPARVERLLAAFARRSDLVPARAHRVRDPKTLPEELQVVVSRAVAHVWICYSRGSRYWLFTGVVSRALSQLHEAPVLEVNCYSDDGRLVNVGAWTVRQDGKWRRVRG